MISKLSIIFTMRKDIHPLIDERKAVRAKCYLHILFFFYVTFSLAKIKKIPFYD